MLTTNLGQYSENQTQTTEEICLESFALPEHEKPKLMNGYMLRDIQMLDIMDEYHPDRLTLENQIELNQRLYSVGMGSVERVTKHNFETFQQQLTMGLVDKFKKWREDWKDIAKDNKVKTANGLEFLEKLVERISDMEGYEAKSEEVDIKLKKISEICMTDGKGLSDFNLILENMGRFLSHIDVIQVDVFEMVKKSIKDGNAYFNFIEKAKDYYNLTSIDEDVRGDETQYILGNYQDAINRIIATEPNVIDLANGVHNSDGKRMDKDVTVPVISLKEMERLAKQLIKHAKTFEKKYDVKKIDKQMKDNVAEIEKIADDDMRRARMIMKTMSANHSFFLFAGDEQYEGAFVAMITYLRECFKTYKKKS